jgi:hypothetical protein
MKISLRLLILSLMLVAGCVHKNRVSPSPEVLASFESRFGKDVSSKWELSDDQLYIANFTFSAHHTKSFFDKNGSWIKTETELASSELSSVIVKTVLGAYKGYNISKSLKIDEKEKETIYRLSLSRGGKITDVELNSGGVIMESGNR